MKLKIGDWAYNEYTEETFVILKIDDYCIPMTTYSEEAYYDIYYGAHTTHHCRKATQEEIEKECAIMLELEFK